MIKKYLLFLLVLIPFVLRSQARSSINSDGKTTIANDVLGFGFDVRTIDPLNWGNSSKGKKLIHSNYTSQRLSNSSDVSFHFVTNPYEFEKELLQSDTIDRPFACNNSQAYYRAFKQDGNDKLLFVYSQKRNAVQKRSLSTLNLKDIDSALIEDFRRLGRDITPEGFLSRYGSHYAQEVVYGGIFLKRNVLDASNYIYSPFAKEEFKQKVIEDIVNVHTQNGDSNDYINSGKSSSYSTGGNEDALWIPQWENGIESNIVPIAVVIAPISEMLSSIEIPNIEGKKSKIALLNEATLQAQSFVKRKLLKKRNSNYYKKYSLQFRQELTSIVKKSTGRDTNEPNTFTGDLFFGGFSKDDAILRSKPFVEYGGLRLETLITDEVVNLQRSAIITIKPEDIDKGYVSVWDDTKKLFKGGSRTTLRVSGPKAAKTTYKEALHGKITKEVEIVTVDKDVYHIIYTLELLKDDSLIKNINSTAYNYILDSQLIAAAATGNQELLEELYSKNASVNADGLLASMISNKIDNEIFNYVLDKGAQPSTDDLELLFERENFDEAKILNLLERGATPKNNMIFKAVAFKSANIIYALFREGAIPRNNDLAFALERYHYPTIKALMSEEFEEFEAGKNELLLAAENNDEDLAQKFIDLGATADAYILDKATQHDNLALRNIIVPVTEASGETLEVVANLNDTNLFDYFISKNAKIDNNKAAEIATDNNNTYILDLALKNGGKATAALDYAIKQDNKPAIEVSLKNKAKPDAVFTYAVKKGDYQLFNDALTIYGGTPSIALEQAVKRDVLPLAKSVLANKSEEINPTEAVSIAVSNKSLDMVKLLVSNNANPNQGMQRAIEVESVPITEYLITQGANTVDTNYLKEAVKRENFELSKVLIEKGQSKPNNAIVEASNTGNVKITKYLLDKGATANKALLSAMETKNEDVILLLMEELTTFNPSFLLTASRKGNYKVVKNLLEKGIDPTIGLLNAIRYKKPAVLNLLLESGGQVTPNLLEIALSYNFFEGVKLILNKNVLDLNQPFSNGQYSFHSISESYDQIDNEMIALLLEKGADINAQNSNGETALHLAALVRSKDKNLVEILLANGADTKIKTKSGKLAIDYAIDKPIKVLLKKASKARKRYY